VFVVPRENRDIEVSMSVGHREKKGDLKGADSSGGLEGTRGEEGGNRGLFITYTFEIPFGKAARDRGKQSFTGLEGGRRRAEI